MLNLLPKLFDYLLIAPLILRLTLAIFLFLKAKKKIGSENHSDKVFGYVGILTSLFLAIGFYVQAVALISIALNIKDMWLENKNTTPNRSEISISALLLIISVSLMFLGAGFLAIDLHLL